MDWMSAKAHAPNSLKENCWCNDAYIVWRVATFTIYYIRSIFDDM